MKTIRLGIYKHSKTGNLYELLAVAKHSETLEDLFVYECMYDNLISKIWVRPLDMFLEGVEIDGKIVPRFQFVKEKL